MYIVSKPMTSDILVKNIIYSSQQMLSVRYLIIVEIGGE